jgi:hypothetical protein
VSDRPNIPVPDELAAVQEQIKALKTREAQLKQIILTDPETRTGASWIAVVNTYTQQRTDIMELRACHPDLVAEFTFPLEVTRVVLSGVTEDGEIVSARKMRAVGERP